MTTIKNKQTLKPVLVSIEQEADNCFCFHQIRQGNETKKGQLSKKEHLTMQVTLLPCVPSCLRKQSHAGCQILKLWVNP